MALSGQVAKRRFRPCAKFFELPVTRAEFSLKIAMLALAFGGLAGNAVSTPSEKPDRPHLSGRAL